MIRKASAGASRKAQAVLVAGALAVTAGCGIPKEQYDRDVGALEQQIATLEQDRTTAEQRAAQCEEGRATCERELRAIRSQGAQLDEGLRRALERIGELEQVAARQQAVFDRLRQSLDALIKAGKLSVAIVRGQFTVQMADKILFDSGSSSLKREAEDTLRELASILGSIPDRRYQIVGHTDSDGDPDFNWRLSGARARSVHQFMVKEGLAPERVSYSGYGQFQPNAPNDTPENKAQNRRIDIVLIPNMEEFMAPIDNGGPES